jgi:DNA modification methylase
LYAKVTNKGLFDFIKEYEFQMNEFSAEINLPEFSMARFEQKYDFAGTDSDLEEDSLPENDREPVIVNQGDVFILGKHKILCGSFDDRTEVGFLLNGEKARIVNTDPPYNLPADYIGNVDHKTHDNFAMGHGEMSDEEFRDFIIKIMQVSKENTIDGAIHYIFMDFRHAWHMTEAARMVYGDMKPKQVCVWKKDLMALGSFYRAQHELCFLFKSGKEKHVSNVDLMDRIRSNVWEYPSAISVANPDKEQIKNHPTPKPVSMISDCILDTTNENDIVIDWFLGSGTTLIACEQTNRRCIATEIEPKYVQNIIKRYVQYCKKQSKILNFEHLNGSLTINDFTKLWEN